MSLFMNVVDNDATFITESLNTKFDLLEEEYVLEGIGDVLSSIKDKLLEWLKWFKDKLVAIFGKIKDFLGNIVNFFIRKVRSAKKAAKEWYDKMMSNKKEASKESFEPLLEGATLDELAKDTIPGKVVNGFEHANFKDGLFEYINPVVDGLYKAALSHDIEGFKQIQGKIDNYKNMGGYMVQVLGINQVEETHKYDAALGERLMKTAKRVTDSYTDMYSGKFTNYINQLNNKIKTDNTLDKEKTSFIQHVIGKLSTLCTFFKDGMAMIVRQYCYNIERLVNKHERYLLMKKGMEAGNRFADKWM